jgi:hypothetical protein
MQHKKDLNLEGFNYYTKEYYNNNEIQVKNPSFVEPNN